MFRIAETQVGELDALVLEGGDSVVEVVPSRGGLVTRFRVGDDELLYLDPATVADPAKNVRGGIPVLFPFAGRLEGDAYALDDRSWSLKQHGFARNLPWRVVDRMADAHSARLSLELLSSEATRAVFPREFAVKLDIVLHSGLLRIETTIENRDARPLPHALGFHPYFRVPDAQKEDAAVETDAEEGWDNFHRQPLAVGTPDFTREELDWHLFDHTLPGTLLLRRPLRPIRMAWADAFETLVLWTQKGKDFICVEPWVAPAGAFPSGHRVRELEPGRAERLWFEISV